MQQAVVTMFGTLVSTSAHLCRLLHDKVRILVVLLVVLVCVGGGGVVVVGGGGVVVVGGGGGGVASHECSRQWSPCLVP